MKNFFSALFLALALGLTLRSGALAPKVSGVVPLVDAKSDFLLGGSKNGRWLDAKTTARELGKSARTYRLYSATRFLERASASAPQSLGAPCPDTLFSKITSPKTRINALQNAEFGVGGIANALPRAPRIEGTNQAAYRVLVAAILKSHGIARPVVKITQIWRVDLEGDGPQEVLLSANNKKEYGGDSQSISSSARAGDYSFLLLRKLVRGKVKDILLEGEFYPRAKTFNAPAFYRIAAVLDANGDGKMEVLGRGRYYEGEWTTLYSVEDERAREVLSAACGA